METNDLFPIEQKDCKNGCKDQFLIDRMIIEDSKSKRRNLRMDQIDYCKAFYCKAFDSEVFDIVGY